MTTCVWAPPSRGDWHIQFDVPLGFIVPLVLGFLYTWIYNRTGSMLLCLLHAGITPAQKFLTLAGPRATADGSSVVDSTDLVVVGVYVVAALVLTLATRGRPGVSHAARSTAMLSRSRVGTLQFLAGGGLILEPPSPQ